MCTFKLDSRLEELLAVQASELVEAAVDPMTGAPAAGAFKNWLPSRCAARIINHMALYFALSFTAPLTALTRHRCAVNMDTASVPLTRFALVWFDYATPGWILRKDFVSDKT